ncbi:hypothetical protein E3Q18_03152 [Wallemia mellicola]|nr:hypothetical protein E3Q18_03152 [Wallemia mellicola]
MDGNRSTPKIPPPEGMIYPPPDIRNKTANYVANSPHGPLLEEKIREKERANAKFAFLNSADAYHGYYRWKSERIKAGDKEVDIFTKSTLSTPSISQTPSFMPSKPIPKEPIGHEFTIEIPDNALAIDLDIIRLTALFTARRGKSFISMLGGRENRNPQFDFLRPNHSLFGLFNNFVEQYLKVIKGTSAPLDEEFDKLSLSQKKSKLVDNAKSRSEWEAYKREGLKKREQESEKETLAFQSIDWQDFVVCETIEITETDKVLELPKPLSIKEVRNLAMAQKRMTSLLEEEVVTNPNTGAQDVDVVMEAKQPQSNTEQSLSQPSATPAVSNAPEGMKIKTNYVPKCKSCNSSHSYSRSPISGALVPNEEFANHLRIELLDPKWQENKEYAESRRQASVLLQQGADVASSLKNLAQGRTDIFGQDMEKAEQRKREAEAAAQEVKRKKEAGVWDGHTASAETVAQRYQAQATSEVQAERINQTLGINQPQQATTAGPQVNSYGDVYDPSGVSFSAAPSGPSAPKFHMPNTGNVRTAEQAEIEPFSNPSKRLKVQKLPEGQYYTEDEWLSYHPDGYVSLTVKLPVDTNNPEWGLDGSVIKLSPTPLTSISGVIREYISEALEAKNGEGKRGPPIGRMRLDFGNITLSNSKSLASYNLDDGDQLKLLVRQGKK